MSEPKKRIQSKRSKTNVWVVERQDVLGGITRVTYAVCREKGRMSHTKRNMKNTPTTLAVVLRGLEYNRGWWTWALQYAQSTYWIRNVETGEKLPPELFI